MELLVRHKQHTTPNGRVHFELWVKYELSEDEEHLVRRYGANQAILYLGNFRRDVARAILIGVPAGLVAASVLTALLPLPLGVVFLLLLLGMAGGTGLVYQHIREQVTVSDVLLGRSFTCKSVLTLAQKERLLTRMSVLFRDLIEKMKTWGEVSITVIEPGKLPVLQLVDTDYEVV
jgi:hypothetical protein